MGFAGCAAIAIGCFLPFRHVMYRDVTALQSGPGFAFLVFGIAAALFTRARRYRGASFCAAAVLVLLGVQYAMMSRVNVISSVFWNVTGASGADVMVGPVGRDVHPDVGFYVIAVGAMVLALSPLYRGRDAAVQHARRSAYAVPERNGHATIGEREFDRTDRTE